MELAIDQWIERLIQFFGLEGPFMLLLTAPLAFVQGIFGIFPFTTLILLNISSLGLVPGLVSSWLIGTASAIAVFLIFRCFFFQRLRNKWVQQLQRYEKWKYYIDMYGVWTIIFLRTLPIVPNNLITFMAAISPIHLRSYIWSSVLGNLSHIWLFGMISSSIIMPEVNVTNLWYVYIACCLILTLIFFARNAKTFKKFRKKDEDLRYENKKCERSGNRI